MITDIPFKDEVDEAKEAITELITEGAFIGKEFLTWLWWKSSINGGVFTLKDGRSIGLHFLRRLVLESGTKEARELIACSGLMASMKEARVALSMGKKVLKARIELNTGDIVWQATISADTFDISSLKIVKGRQAQDGSHILSEDAGYGEGEKGRLLYSFSLIKEFTKIFYELFFMFISIRTNEQEWESEKEALSLWIKNV